VQLVIFYQYLSQPLPNHQRKMNEITLERSFLRRPRNSVGILIFVFLIFEGISWSAATSQKLLIAERSGGAWPYIYQSLFTMLLPELVTMFVLIKLINVTHEIRRIHTIPVSLPGVVKYQFALLPTLLLAFFVFNPLTQTVRFLAEAFPNYQFSNWWHSYIAGTFRPRIYFVYLIPSLLIGYLAINYSLLMDYLAQRARAQEAVKAEAAELAKKLAQQQQAMPAAKPIPTYLTHLRGRNDQGELLLAFRECAYIEIDGKYYYAIHPGKGRYLVAKSLNELEAELDPYQFFRIKRDCIVNRDFVIDYAYWEKGKYILRLNTPCHHELTMPKARMQEFRSWLRGDPDELIGMAESPSLMPVYR
jgi:two-component system, LytTR family, response regulator